MQGAWGGNEGDTGVLTTVQAWREPPAHCSGRQAAEIRQHASSLACWVPQWPLGIPHPLCKMGATVVCLLGFRRKLNDVVVVEKS